MTSGLTPKMTSGLTPKMSEYFKEIGENIIENENKTIIKVTCGWNTGYGATIIDPSSRKDGEKSYIWKFKIIQGITSIYIGIECASKPGIWINDNFAAQRKNKNYAYSSQNGRKYAHNTPTGGLFSSSGLKYDKKYGTNDIILMKLDLSNSNSFGILSFKNGLNSCWNIAFDKIEKNEKIIMAVSLWGDKFGGGYGASVELLDFIEISNDKKQESKMEEKEEKEEEEEEEKNNNMNIDIKYQLKHLQTQFNEFIDNVNKQKLINIYDKSPNSLFIHKEINEFDIKLAEFNKHFNETKTFISSISTPDIKCYEKWGIDEIIQWIAILDDGHFIKYLEILKKGFLSDDITSDCLPEIDKQTLRAQPFNIQNFKDRLSLEKHFKSLKIQNNDTKQNNIIHQNEEGNIVHVPPTAYI